eukprot:CAMPEP_0196583768 /NCGR_PEP_ID=MMETSP1081-20130531/44591_1 /TAXON_ID=36882 /ORGANISM="Pyramimonas amylifera, Strain CCMP720" /LENGTH=105 /DNA_ID=CAMNT_0041904745 /DNA_START=27 /DNA_END=341 /DNA_ORIENTATION=-
MAKLDKSMQLALEGKSLAELEYEALRAQLRLSEETKNAALKHAMELDRNLGEIQRELEKEKEKRETFERECAALRDQLEILRAELAATRAERDRALEAEREMRIK